MRYIDDVRNILNKASRGLGCNKKTDCASITVLKSNDVKQIHQRLDEIEMAWNAMCNAVERGNEEQARRKFDERS